MVVKELWKSFARNSQKRLNWKTLYVSDTHSVDNKWNHYYISEDNEMKNQSSRFSWFHKRKPDFRRVRYFML